jgi:hypothetical protein
MPPAPSRDSIRYGPICVPHHAGAIVAEQVGCCFANGAVDDDRPVDVGEHLVHHSTKLDVVAACLRDETRAVGPFEQDRPFDDCREPIRICRHGATRRTLHARNLVPVVIDLGYDIAGLTDRAWQSLYHLALGIPMEDRLLRTGPGYAWEHVAQPEGNPEPSVPLAGCRAAPVPGRRARAGRPVPTHAALP